MQSRFYRLFIFIVLSFGLLVQSPTVSASAINSHCIQSLARTSNAVQKNKNRKTQFLPTSILTGLRNLLKGGKKSNQSEYHQQPMEVVQSHAAKEFSGFFEVGDGAPKVIPENTVPVSFAIQNIASVIREKLPYEDANRLIRELKVILVRSLNSSEVEPILGFQDYETMILFIPRAEYNKAKIDLTMSTALKNIDRLLKKKYPDLVFYKKAMNNTRPWLVQGFDAPEAGNPSMKYGYLMAQFMSYKFPGQRFAASQEIALLQDHYEKISQLQTQVFEGFKNALGDMAIARADALVNDRISRPLASWTFPEGEVTSLSAELNAFLRKKFHHLDELRDFIGRRYGMKNISDEFLKLVVDYFDALKILHPPLEYESLDKINFKDVSSMATFDAQMPQEALSVFALDHEGLGGVKNMAIQFQVNAQLIRAQKEGLRKENFPIRSWLEELNHRGVAKWLNKNLDATESAIREEARKIGLPENIVAKVKIRKTGDEATLFIPAQIPASFVQGVLKYTDPGIRFIRLVMIERYFNDSGSLATFEEVSEMQHFGELVLKAIKENLMDDVRNRSIQLGARLSPLARAKGGKLQFQLQIFAYPSSEATNAAHLSALIQRALKTVRESESFEKLDTARISVVQ